MSEKRTSALGGDDNGSSSPLTFATGSVKIALNGARGRMGLSITRLIQESHGKFSLMHSLTMTNDVIACIKGEDSSYDVLIDFSTPPATAQLAEIAVGCQKPLLIGTTGLTPQTLEILEECAMTAPVMIAPNTSLGVAVLKSLVRHAAKLLGDSFDIDIVEAHHRHKKDAPSGTAKALQEAIASSRPVALHSIRAGEIIGRHAVHFQGSHESIELTHTATSRDVFAKGALYLAEWLTRQAPGLYTPDDAYMCLDLCREP